MVNHPNDSLAMDYEMASWVGKLVFRPLSMFSLFIRPLPTKLDTKLKYSRETCASTIKFNFEDDGQLLGMAHLEIFVYLKFFL